MDFERLYLMGDGWLRGAFRTMVGRSLDAVSIARAETTPSTPIVCRYYMGGKPRDLVGTGYPEIKLLSDRVIGILRDKKFSGWSTYPVEIYGKRGERIEGYHGFAVTGRCGRIQWSKGRKIRKPAPVPGGQPYDAWVGMYFSPRSWDGSDIFMPKNATCIIVTELVMTALTRAKVTNIHFKRLTEFERSWDL